MCSQTSIICNGNNVGEYQEWNIVNVLDFEHLKSANYGIIVLNRPISHNSRFIADLWMQANLTLTADGGTNRWDSFVELLDYELRSRLRPPDLITGDFDSIMKEIKEKYEKKGSKIIHTPDQNATDFSKAICEMHSHSAEHGIPIDYVTVIAETSGRIDHIMANINTLFLCRKKMKGIYLLSKESISWLLNSGNHKIYVPEKLTSNNCWCSLVPVGEASVVSSRGLKWNLDNQTLKFGGLVSTSNTYDASGIVEVTCDKPLLWSMEISPLLSEHSP